MVFDNISVFCVQKLPMIENVFCMNVEKYFFNILLKKVEVCWKMEEVAEHMDEEAEHLEEVAEHLKEVAEHLEEVAEHPCGTWSSRRTSF